MESLLNFCAVFPIYYYDFDLSWEKPILPNSQQILQKKKYNKAYDEILNSNDAMKEKYANAT